MSGHLCSNLFEPGAHSEGEVMSTFLRILMAAVVTIGACAGSTTQIAADGNPETSMKAIIDCEKNQIPMKVPTLWAPIPPYMEGTEKFVARGVVITVCASMTEDGLYRVQEVATKFRLELGELENPTLSELKEKVHVAISKVQVDNVTVQSTRLILVRPSHFAPNAVRN